MTAVRPVLPVARAGTDHRAAAAALLAAACGIGGLVALVAGSRAVWPVALTAAGIVLVAGLRVVSRVRLATVPVALGVAASCWDAVRIGSTSLFDALCAVGVLAVLASALLRRDTPIRWPGRVYWITFGGFALATALVALFPADSFYMASRFELSGQFLAGAVSSATSSATAAAGGTAQSDLGGLARLLIGLIVLPLVLGWYVRGRADLETVGRAFVGGAFLSSLIGLTDYLGITTVGAVLLGYAPGENRSTALTTQPNHLALTAVMALPLLWFLFRRWPLRIAGGLVLLGGIFVSGSRAGIIGAAVALVGCLFWQYRARFLLLLVPGGVALLLTLSELLSYTRFGTVGAEDSDLERTQVLNQGLEDFGHSPLFGVGLRVAQEAHVVYLQLLASSGLIGFLSFALLLGSAIAIAFRMRDRPVVLAAGISLTAYLVVASASNALLVRYLFVPVAIVFVASRISWPGDPSDPDRPAMAAIVDVVDTPGVRGR